MVLSGGRASDETRKGKLRVCGYADDVAAVIKGNLLGILRDRMKKALRIIEDWCGERDLAVNPNETKRHDLHQDIQIEE
ncbi:reverse transcriptase [Lasius niger]|uniref:Reverse transcriptase n=1 Tax=Lasius niger TaxID=67767 RepID=A0A0J7N777_LASNI|nr:reverse transcriptase [Lasius niger]